MVLSSEGMRDMLARLARAEREIERLRSIEVHGAPIRRLSYEASSDLLNGTAVGATTTDVISDQSFTVGSTTSLLQFSLRGGMLLTNGTISRGCQVQLYVDNTYAFAMGLEYLQTASQFISPIAGGEEWQTGFSAGTHTVRVRIVTFSAGNTLYLRAATHPAEEYLRLMVNEFPT